MTQIIEPEPISAPATRPRWGVGVATPEITRFLQGPQTRGFELMRAVRVFGELIRGFRALHFVGPCVTVFGSARFRKTTRITPLAGKLVPV